MKKMIKFTMVITIIFALLSGNIAVIAANATADNSAQTSNAKNSETELGNQGESEGKKQTVENEHEPLAEDVQSSAESEKLPVEDKQSSAESEKALTENEQSSAKSGKSPVKSDSKTDEDTKNEIALPAQEGETESTASGKLYVTLHLKLPNSKIESGDFEVTLVEANPKEEVEAKTYTATGSGKGTDGKLSYEIDEIETDPNAEDGKTDYKLSVTSAKGKNNYYQNYAHLDVAIKPNMITTLEITNCFDVNSIKGDKTRAVMGIGDITKKDEDRVGEINQNDIGEMIRSIESEENTYDLNGDGNVNIIDLSYIAFNKGNAGAQTGFYGYDQIIQVSEETFAEQEKSETTKIEKGELENIFKNNNEFVQLAPKNEGDEITETTPVELTIDLGDNENKTEEITIAPSSNPENNIQSGEVTVAYTDESGAEQKMSFVIGTPGTIVADAVSGERLIYELAEIPSDVPKDKMKNAEIESDGTIVVDLGGQVAVKKVTIKVTGTKSKRLADIAKVEFLNGMDERIPPPSIEIPTNLTGSATYDSLVISWDSMSNVTGYEVEIKKKGTDKVEYHRTEANQITLEQFQGEKFEDQHFTPFLIRVQSINGEWRSGYCKEEKALELTPEPNKKPDPPDNLFVKGGVKEVTATWKNMKSTLSYDVQYKRKDENDWKTAIEGLKTNQYKITGLEDNVTYQVQVRGENAKGKGEFCTPGEATTTTVEPAKLPRYGAINLPSKDSSGNEQKGVLTQHVIDAVHGYRADNQGAITYMVDSNLDEGKSSTASNQRPAQGVVDNSFTSHYYVRDWDDGGTYNAGDATKGVTITFDEEQEINYITTAQIENLGNIVKANIIYWGEDNVKKGPISASQVVTKRDEKDRDYTAIKLPETIKAKKINVQIGRYSWDTRKITMAEIRFHNIGTLGNEVDALFTDQMHLELAENVNEGVINSLQERLNKPDENGEFNPEKENIQKELDLARDLLSAKKAEITKIDPTVTTKKDGHITFRGGLNAWQPLGVVAHANETIKIYIGNPNKKIGDSTDLKLIPTQYHAEAAYWKGGDITNLKVGVNEITIPQIITTGKEKGGSLYIEYTGNNPSDEYAVRVSGGESIPVLDLTKLDKTATDYEAKRTEAITKYVGEIEAQVSNLQTNHDTNHKEIKELNYDYNPDAEEDCIAGATEIVLDQMMYSVSARKILEGLDDEEDKVTKLDKSLTAMDDMIDLFYTHKGLSKDEKAGATNQYPSSRLNIRYHIMFAGAAMYAGGQHIGIPYGDVATLSKGNPIEMDEKGKYVSGNYFGWGIAHEIGHIINESCYVHGEVTNNYFSVLSQAQDTNNTVRFQYPEVYKKVMSGKTGKSQNVFTQLGLYWQFHLANDTGKYNFDTSYSSYEEQFNDLVFARMDTYAREFAATKKTSAPTNGGLELKLNTTQAPYVTTDNNLMRLACAATQHNVLTFFEKWGMEPDSETIQYANQFEKIYEGDTKKEKAIWFINDDARAYQIAKEAPMTKGTAVQATVENVEGHTNQKAITLSTTGNNVPESILGYEIKRISWAYGDEVETPVGFITAEELKDTEKYPNGKYIDTIEAVNNRVFEYRIVAYDKYLNSTEEFVTNQFKVQNDGYQGKKSDWEITTNFKTEEEINAETNVSSNKSDCSASEQEVEGNRVAPSVESLIDNKYDVDYKAKNTTNSDGEIVIALPEQTNLTGLKYKTSSNKELTDYTISVSENGTDWEDWENVAEGHVNSIDRILNTKLEDGTCTIYFDPNGTGKLHVYEVNYIKISTKDKEIALSEIDLIGRTGDNIEFIEQNGRYGIGILDQDVILEKDESGNPTHKIPAGSIVFTGTYKGNPAYNTPVVYLEDGTPMNSIGAIFAPELTDDEKDKLGEVSEGTWIYWLEENNEDTKEMFNKVKNGEITKVRAELYRTDDAIELYGERLTSDTFLVKIPRKDDGSLYSIHVDSGE